MATFGKTVVGSTGTEGFDMGASGVYTCRFIAPESGTITMLSAYLYWGDFPRSIIPVIYADLNDKPGKLLAIGSPTEQVADGWIELLTNLGFDGGKPYHLGICTPSSMWMAADPGEIEQAHLDGVNVYPNPNNPFGTPALSYDRELSIYATYTPGPPPPPGQGTLEVHAHEDSVEVEASVEIVGVATYLAPFTIDLDVGNYTLNGSYGAYPVQTKLAEILEGQLTVVNFVFTAIPPPKHMLTVNSTPIEGVPFTLEKM